MPWSGKGKGVRRDQDTASGYGIVENQLKSSGASLGPSALRN